MAISIESTPTIHLDRLRIIGNIAQTQGSAVYRAEWETREVVIKTFEPEGSLSNDFDNFLKEIKVMEICKQSPHITQLLGTTPLGSKPFAYIMESMETTLDKRLADSTQVLPWPVRYRFALQICRGLAYMHGCGILHGDVKSPNMLLSRQGDVKLCDFGYSVIKDSPTTFLIEGQKNKKIRCTPRWVQPERVDNPSLSYVEACDVYSFGLVTWEIASRKLPYKDAATSADIIRKIRLKQQDPIPIDCPAAYAKWIERSRSFDPNNRPSMHIICQGLEQLLALHDNHSS